MAASFTVARVRGIPIRLHATFLLALPLFAYLMAQAYFAPEGRAPDATAWTWGALLAVGLFASVLLHELAHSLVAMRMGIGVRDITLLPIGGVSAFQRIPRDPRAEFWITFVGPLTNLVLAAPLLLWWWAGGVPNVPVGLPRFVEWLGWTNLSLGLFNLLLPAFPMDGGRIVRALLSRRVGHVRATHVAASLGRAAALGLGLVGLLAGNLILVLLAFFVFAGAGSEEHATVLTETLARYRVGELATRVPALDAGASVEDAIARLRAEHRLVLPVVEADRALGLAHLEALARIPEALRAATILRDAFVAVPTMVADAPASGAAEALAQQGGGPALVVAPDGGLVGILGRDELERASAVEALLEARPRGVFNRSRAPRT